MPTPITIWSIITEEGNVKFNHIESKWKDGKYPQPLCETFTNQKAWEKLKWRKELGYLVDGVVERVNKETFSKG